MKRRQVSCASCTSTKAIDALAAVRRADSARARRASNAQASASNAAASSSWSSGITTGSPTPVIPTALGAACAASSAQCVAVVSTACDLVTSDDPACTPSERSWGAGSRWFKSSRPDRSRPLIFPVFPGRSGASAFSDVGWRWQIGCKMTEGCTFARARRVALRQLRRRPADKEESEGHSTQRLRTKDVAT